MSTGMRVASRWRVPRTHGVVAGGLLVLLGLWGGVAPLIGPYLGYGFTPDVPWSFTAGRLWLQVLPAAVTVVAAVVLVFTSSRVTGLWASWLTVLAGAWFVVGGPVSRLWNDGTSLTGSPTGGVASQVAEQLGLFLGLGVVIVFLGAVGSARFALPRTAPAASEWQHEPYPVAPEEETQPGDILP